MCQIRELETWISNVDQWKFNEKQNLEEANLGETVPMARFKLWT